MERKLPENDEHVLLFKGTIHTEDLECRKWVEKLDAKIDVINERTKVQTREIKELEKKIKEIK
jgi:peptidoglycan hydrolase CwlO-like protein